MLSLDERYEMLKMTLKECGSDLLKKTDEEICCYLFEEIPIDINCFLHNNSLSLLLNEGLIDGLIYSKCIELRNFFNENIDSNKHATKNELKVLTVVKRFVEMADTIIDLLYL